MFVVIIKVALMTKHFSQAIICRYDIILVSASGCPGISLTTCIADFCIPVYLLQNKHDEDRTWENSGPNFDKFRKYIQSANSNLVIK